MSERNKQRIKALTEDARKEALDRYSDVSKEHGGMLDIIAIDVPQNVKKKDDL
ncbi:hypothetical protein [Sharpea azabuensis]|uniref:hypothetical protein n=1 Tax=Sharpea azabuensis TaxID=322505 RepID=UPI001568C9C9|nr:hypothetical protein [Sharpea azabuensis]